MNTLCKIFTFVSLFIPLFISGCATLPNNVNQPESYALTGTEDTAWGRMRQDEKSAHPGQSGFVLLENGLDAFVAWALLADYAARSMGLLPIESQL